MQMLHLMHPFGSLTKQCTVSGMKRNERTQSSFLDPRVMFWFVLVSFVTVQKTMQMLHLMHPFGSLTKRCTVSSQKRNERIHIFGPNSDVLVRFGQFRYSVKNHAGVAFNAPIQVVNETTHSFGPKTKRTHPIHVFGPNSDVLVHFGQFRYSAKNHANVAFNAPIQVVNETTHSFGTETKRTHPIHVFGPNSDVLVRFGLFRYKAKNHANVAFTAPIQVVNEMMHSFDPETKRTHPIHVFGPNSDVLVRFCQFRYCAKNHANVAFNAPIRVVNETKHCFRPETKRTHPIHVFGPKSDVLVRFGQFRYGAKNHVNAAFNAPIRVVNETMHSFDSETKRTHPIHVFGPNSDVLVRFGQFHYCAKNHANAAFNAPIRVVNETMHSFRPETKRTHPIHVFGHNSDVLVRFGQFRDCAKNHANVAFNAPIRVVNETMHTFDPETKRTHPIQVFGPNSDLLVRFCQFRYCAKNNANVAFNAPNRVVNETMHSFDPETKRTHPIHVVGANSDFLVRFG